MPSHRDNPKLHRSRAAGSTKPERMSADIIGLQAYRPLKSARRDADALSRLPQTAQSSELAHLLTVLKTEVTIAAGITRGLSETLVQLQDSVAAMEDGIAPSEASRIQALLLKQIAYLRETVTAASNDLRHVVPAGLAQILDAARSHNPDIVYS